MSIYEEARSIISEVVQKSSLRSGDLFVVGCSTSEVVGGSIGKASSMEVAQEIYRAFKEVLDPLGVGIVAQCCEHLNRCLVIEASDRPYYATRVNVVPHSHAGGSFATTCYEAFREPIVVENLRCQGGIDIGDTLIGMHLDAVAVPLRLEVSRLGEAHILAARTRPKFVGGSRAVYDIALAGHEIER